MSWTLIVAGFDEANETINFGNRIVSDESLFEISTLATISCEEQNTKNPSIFSTTQDGRLYLAIDTTFQIFSENCSNQDIVLCTENLINCFCVSFDNNLVLLCLSSGIVQCLDTRNSTIIFQTTIEENNDDRFFISARRENIGNNFSFILTTKVGKVYRLTIKDVTSLYDEISKTDKHTEVQLIVNEICNVNFDTLVDCLSQVSNKLFVFGKKAAVFDTSEIDGAFSFANLTNITKLYDIENGLFIGLNASGNLIAICPELLQETILINNQTFKDIIFIQDDNEAYILGLTNPNEESDFFIQLISFSSFELIFNLHVTEHLYLTNPNNRNDDTIFIEGIKNLEDVIYQLRIKAITECNPGTRLRRILRRGLFDEAEQFAKNYNLNVEPVWLARAQKYLEKLRCTKEEINELVQIFDNINDIKFLAQCCNDVTVDSLDSVRRLHEYLQKRIRKTMVNNPDDKRFWKLLNSTMTVLSRLETFMFINIKNISNQDIIQQWEDFSQLQLLELMEKYLQSGQIRESILIFSKLDKESKKEITIEKVEEILYLLPTNIDMMDLIPWLRNFFTFAITTLPKCLNVFIKWLYDNLLQLEADTSYAWPQYALDFASKILSILKVNENDIELYFSLECSENILKQVGDIISALEDIQILNEQFGIKISLQSYKKNPKIVIKDLLNSASQTMNRLQGFIENFLKNYLIKHKLNLDLVLTNYIDEIVNLNYRWQDTVKEILPCMSSTSVKLNNVKVILNRADVPWTETVMKIAQDSVKEQHPLTKDIQYLIDTLPQNILLKKYFMNNCRNVNLSDEDDLMYIIERIFKSSQKDKIKDIETLADKYPNMKKLFSLEIFHYYVENENYIDALRYLDTLEDNIRTDCCVAILNTTSEYIDSNLNDIAKGYMEVQNSVFSKLSKNSSDCKIKIYSKLVDQNKKFYALKNTYEYPSLPPILKDQKLNLLTELITKIYRKVELQEINWVDGCKASQHVAQQLDLEEELGLFELIKQSKSLSCMITAGEILLEKNNPNSNDLCKLAALLFKHMCDEDDTLDFDAGPEDATSQLTTFNATLAQLVDQSLSSQNYIRALNLSHELTLRACSVADSFDLPAALEMLHWTVTTQDMRITEESSLSRWTCTPVYYSEIAIPPPFGVVSVVRDIFCMYLDIARDSPSCNVLNRNCFTNFVEIHDNQRSNVPIDAKIQQLFHNLKPQIEQLHTEGHDITALYLLHELKLSFQNLNLDSQLTFQARNILSQIIISQAIYPLLDKIITMKKVDEDFAISLLLSIGAGVRLKEGWLSTTMKKYKMNINKLSTIMTLGLRCAKILKFDDMHRDGYLDLKLRCKWWKRCFSNFTKYIEYFQMSCKKLAQLLIYSDEINLENLQEFCSDFKLNIQEHLSAYLHHILFDWKPEITVVTIDDKKSITVKNCEKELFKKCYDIIVLIHDRESVLQLLEKNNDLISYYSYEISLCILELLTKMNPEYNKPTDMLLFLKTYTRICKPQQREIEEWEKNFPYATEFDPLGEYRLPYRPELYMADVWKILKPEINLETYLKWFEAIEIFKLDKNDICTFAIKGRSTRDLFATETTSWQLQPCNDRLLVQISECVSHMTNLEQATAVLYQVVLSCPGGHDQVMLATKCWELCQLWANTNEDCLADSLEKVQRKYISCCTEHILYSHLLGDEKYLKLLIQPQQLIEALYSDNRIVQRSQAVILHCPDINAAVTDIAILHDMDVQVTRMYIIECLLQPKSATTLKADTTITTTNMFSFQQNDLEESSEDDSLIRICYICESFADNAQWAELLTQVGLAHSDETEDISVDEAPPTLSVRVRALKCLAMLTKGEAKLDGVEDFGDYFEKLQLLERLESLGVALELEQLNNCDKIDLVKKLGQSHGHNPKAVAIMASICHQFNLGQPLLWERILKKFIQLGMVNEMKVWLPKLKDYGQLTSGSTYLAAWNKLVDSMFGNVRQNMTLQDTQQILQAFLLLQTCPISSSLNLISICGKCLQIRKPEFAALLLPYLSPLQQKEIIQVLTNVDLIYLQKNINFFEAQGVLTAGLALEMLSN